MSRTERTEIHPVEILIVAALLTADALITVLTALVALILTLTSQKPSASRTKPAPPAPTPMVHPLCALVATQLQGMTCEELRGLAGTRRKLPKHTLIGMVAAGV